MVAYPDRMVLDSQWLNEIPAHWRLGRLDQVARAWPSNVDKHSVEGELAVRLCNYTDVYKNASIVEGMDFMQATASREQIDKFRLAVGDTLLTKDSETADDIGVPAFVEYEAADLVCGYHLSIVRPDAFVADPKFLYWALAAQPTLGQWAVLASGVTRVGIKSGDLARVALALPPLGEQRVIAQYLDRETARIDTLIEEQQRLIEMLRERRTAVIRHASEAPDAPTVRLAWFARVSSGDGLSLNEVSRGDDSAGSVPVFGGNGRMGYAAKSNVGCTILAVGRVGALCGNVHRVDAPAWVTDNALMIDDLRDFDVDFLRWHLEGRNLNELSRSTAQPLITGSQVAALRVPMPTLNEQQRISAYLDEQTAKIDELVAEAERFIELSRERRAALITAAVTGQIDVREVA